MTVFQIVGLVAVGLLLVGAFWVLLGVRALQPPAPNQLFDRLEKSRTALGQRLRSVFGRGVLDEDFWSDLQEALIEFDIGVGPSASIVEQVRGEHPRTAEAARAALHSEILGALSRTDRDLVLDGSPAVVVVIGVNGVGKTTSVAKLAATLKSWGRSPLLAGADTFRAGAGAQLATWAARADVPVVEGESAEDPAAVTFRALRLARDSNLDVVIVDTAGRLHSKTNLMEELGKIVRVLKKEAGAIDEILLVLDATTGHNGIVQVEEFAAHVGVTGIVLTKLDGTARGGMVVGVEQELGIPVKLIGVGEGLEDLLPFEPPAFVEALLA